ncbi:aminodeoxychorismate synthase component I [Cellulosilyticum sp. I15G10I2]|uniref:aminodeoxychorismate synthase component I n=1 Tax=Cellulosilyticum sp. I15G10I2 TaxID=1892843 RepID=UPI00085CB48A|nr:aminodeoxychorismate synthase component I [Cellulosilyticum sp. I15G10I2]
MNTVYYEEIDTTLDSFQIYKLFFQEKYSFFLDSGMDPGRLGRYSFIGANPFLRITSKREKIKIWENGHETVLEGNPFHVLKKLLQRYTIKNSTDLPFIGGAVGYMAYDLCHHIEKLPQRAYDDIDLPEMIMGFYDGIIVIDHLEKRNYAVSAGLPHFSEEHAKAKVTYLKQFIEGRSEVQSDLYLDEPYKNNPTHLESNFTQQNYYKAITKAKEYIRQGDIYQMNMTQRFTTPINRHPLNIYGTLRKINPAPFASFLEFGDFQIVSSSPERFLQIRKGMIETRPIKGTMPRGRNLKEDKANSATLKNSTKDMAENLMIVDLMRNDIGKVCKLGTVKVPELFSIEKYATVFHLVSTVTGELRSSCDAVDCIEATFPGGSITGAPKIRAMEIIDELEPTCRHIYTGSVGYISFDGDMDINIVIRTILIKGDKAYYQVGGGIVWDSVPEKEYQETLDKGAALKKALLNILT